MNTSKFFLCAILLLPMWVLAAPIPAETFGKLQSTLDFCTRSNPQSAMEYRETGMEALRGMTAQQAAEARRSKAYRDSYKATLAELAKVPKGDVPAACYRAMGLFH